MMSSALGFSTIHGLTISFKFLFITVFANDIKTLSVGHPQIEAPRSQIDLAQVIEFINDFDSLGSDCKISDST